MKQELVVDRGQSVSLFDRPPDPASWAVPLSQNKGFVMRSRNVVNTFKYDPK